jgi:hypothetical protein
VVTINDTSTTPFYTLSILGVNPPTGGGGGTSGDSGSAGEVSGTSISPQSVNVVDPVSVCEISSGAVASSAGTLSLTPLTLSPTDITDQFWAYEGNNITISLTITGGPYPPFTQVPYSINDRGAVTNGTLTFPSGAGTQTQGNSTFFFGTPGNLTVTVFNALAPSVPVVSYTIYVQVLPPPLPPGGGEG